MNKDDGSLKGTAISPGKTEHSVLEGRGEETAREIKVQSIYHSREKSRSSMPWLSGSGKFAETENVFF